MPTDHHQSPLRSQSQSRARSRRISLFFVSEPSLEYTNSLDRPTVQPVRVSVSPSKIPVWGESTGGQFTCRAVLFALRKKKNKGGGAAEELRPGRMQLYAKIPWIWSFRWKRIRYLAFRLSTDWRTMPERGGGKKKKEKRKTRRGQRTHVTPNDRWNCRAEESAEIKWIIIIMHGTLPEPGSLLLSTNKVATRANPADRPTCRSGNWFGPQRPLTAAKASASATDSDSASSSSAGAVSE